MIILYIIKFYPESILLLALALLLISTFSAVLISFINEIIFENYLASKLGNKL